MKTIFIYSHRIEDSKLKKKVLKNQDAYDSQIEVWEKGTLLWKGICNVDSSNRTENKIEIRNGTYWGIVGDHKGKYKAILLTRNFPTEADWKRITESERTLMTIQENKNHNGKKIATFINIHKGGDEWDWSEGCITIYYKDYDSFIKFFDYNEIVYIEKV